MSDYTKLVRQEAQDFLEGHHETFLADPGEFGGKSERPHFLQWIDRTASLAARVTEVAEHWGLKEFHWVQTHTRSKAKAGGDPAGNAYASFLRDIRHEIKKLAKK